MLGETLINAYLDANIMLAVAFILWSLVLFAFSKFGLRRAYTTHLRLLNGVILAMAASPFIIYFLGEWSAQHSLNLTDIIVAQYLEGRVEISPSRLENFLGLRETFVRGFTQHQTLLFKILGLVLSIGVIGLSANVLRNVFKLRSVLKNCRPWRTFGNVRILLSDTALIPFSTRSIRYRFIVIPTIMLDNSADIKMAIGHELQHFRQRDVEWAILLEFLTPLFFWNPLFHLWKHQVTQLREFACDQSLMLRPSYDLRTYCECLLRTCSRSLRGNGNFATISPAVAMVDTPVNPAENCSSLLRSRIIALTSGDIQQPSTKLFTLLFVPLIFAISIAALLIQSPPDWSHDRLMLSTIVNLERLDARTAQANLFATRSNN